MRRFLLPALLLLTLAPELHAQTPVEVKRDNGSARGSYTFAGWEEAALLMPAGPARLLELKIY